MPTLQSVDSSNGIVRVKLWQTSKCDFLPFDKLQTIFDIGDLGRNRENWRVQNRGSNHLSFVARAMSCQSVTKLQAPPMLSLEHMIKSKHTWIKIKMTEWISSIYINKQVLKTHKMYKMRLLSRTSGSKYPWSKKWASHNSQSVQRKFREWEKLLSWRIWSSLWVFCPHCFVEKGWIPTAGNKIAQEFQNKLAGQHTCKKSCTTLNYKSNANSKMRPCCKRRYKSARDAWFACSADHHADAVTLS